MGIERILYGLTALAGMAGLYYVFVFAAHLDRWCDQHNQRRKYKRK